MLPACPTFRAPRYMLPKARPMTADQAAAAHRPDAESSKGLHRLLCRPLSHLWQVRS